jgi:hypothetical protein
VSAQVLLQSASGRLPDGQAVITAETLKDFQPSAETVAIATSAFSALGFEVGPFVGNSFSITAPQEHFEQVFKVRLQRQKSGGLQIVGGHGRGQLELSLGSLPQQLQGRVVAVTLTPPPEFGPTQFGP